MADTVEVKVAGAQKFARVVMLLFAACSVCFLSNPHGNNLIVGLMLLVVFLGIPTYVNAVSPKKLDAEGCTLGFGRRFLWKDLKDIRVIAQKRGSQIVNYRFELQFTGATGRFGYNQTVNGREVVTFLEGIAKRKLLPG